jgi:tetratricopeptide (TPR) repeat protein
MDVIWPTGSGKVVVLAAAIAVSIVLLPGKRAGAMQLSPQQKSEMKLHYDKATRAYDVGKYQEAIEEYQKAYEIGGDAAMIYNIAQAYRLSDQLTEAIRFYRRYLQRSPSAPNREIVERRIAELEKVVEERKKAGAPVVPVPPLPAQPPVTTAPNPPPAPPPVPPPPPVIDAQPAPMVPPPPPAPPAPRSRTPYAVVGASLLVAGAVSGALAIWQGKLAQEKADKLSDQSNQKGTYYFNPVIQENGKTANAWAISLGAVGAAAIIGGGIVLLLMPSSSYGEAPSAPHVAPSVAPVIGLDFLGAEAGWSF